MLMRWANQINPRRELPIFFSGKNHAISIPGGKKYVPWTEGEYKKISHLENKGLIILLLLSFLRRGNESH